jgi:hypothetical protein
MLVPHGPTDVALTDIGRGYHIRASNTTTNLSSTFPSGILHSPLVAPLGLILNHLSSIQILKSFHANQKGDKSTNSHKWNLPLDFYRGSIN